MNRKEVTIELTETRTVDWRDIPGTTLKAVRACETISCDGKVRSCEMKVGVIAESRLKKYFKAFDIELLWKQSNKDYGAYLCVSDFELELLRKQGYNNFIKQAIEYKDIVEGIDTSPNPIVVFVNNYNHTVWNVTKTEQYPQAIHFNYIQALMDDSNYDLKGVMSVLEKRNDIEFVTERYDDKIIKDIPYYNQDEDRTQCVEFKWAPSDEDFNSLCEKMKENGGDSTYERFNAISSLDLLGIEKYRLNQE